MTIQPTKSKQTRARILAAALTVFRERGFESATMRDIAAHAGMAVGAAYYYFDSKDALVLAFYAQAQQQMAPQAERILSAATSLEQRLREIIGLKFVTFAPNRELLRALSAHVDPTHPVSPFSPQTAAIRDADLAWFTRAVDDSRVRLPRSILPYLPRLLWLYQMGLILFWVYDRSPKQSRTEFLFDQSRRIILILLKFAGLPLMKPLHRRAADLLRVLYEEA
ncbi:MAG TPA: TetR family transcriptional regulator [Terracidiphilus sp.]